MNVLIDTPLHTIFGFGTASFGCRNWSSLAVDPYPDRKSLPIVVHSLQFIPPELLRFNFIHSG